MSGTIFDLSRIEGHVIHGWQQHDQNNQHWYVQRSGERYVFQNVEAGQFASVNGSYDGSKLHGSGNATTWDLQQDGNEYFVFVAGTNFVIDLDMGRTANGATIHLWDKTGAQQQKWCFEKINNNSGEDEGYSPQYQPPQQQPPVQQPVQQPAQQPPQQQQPPPQQQPMGVLPPGTYTLRNVKTGTVLDLSHGEANEGADIFGYDANGGNNQKWQLQPTGQGQNMTLSNLQARSYASFPGQSFAQGIIVKGSSQPQEYVISAADKGFYISPVQQPGYVLDLVHGSDKNGTKVCVWQNNQQDNQKWYFERA